jgi:ATP-dependent DNA helicase RecG
MSENPEITANILTEKVGITKRRVEDNIAKLKKAGLLEREGSDKQGKWVVIGGDDK